MVSIIIVSYNTEKLLKVCLDSIYKNFTGGKFEVIVVDNASSDKSCKMVKKNFPEVKLVKSEENLGFSKGNNLGCVNTNGDTLLFLNSDTEVVDRSIFDMEKFLNSSEDMGVVGGLLKNEDGSLQRSYGSFYNILTVAKLLIGGDRLEIATQSFKSSCSVDWVSGGFMMIKSNLFKKINGFDENIFMYIEDVELCYRVKKLGFKVYFYPEAYVIHAGQGSSNRTFAVVNIYKNLLYFFKLHKSFLEYNMVKFLLVFKAYTVILVSLFTNKKELRSRYKQALQF